MKKLIFTGLSLCILFTTYAQVSMEDWGVFFGDRNPRVDQTVTYSFTIPSSSDPGFFWELNGDDKPGVTTNNGDGTYTFSYTHTWKTYDQIFNTLYLRPVEAPEYEVGHIDIIVRENIWKTSSRPNSVYFGGGNVGIGTSNPRAKLTVNGKIRAEEVEVMPNINVPDYVFEEDYDLRTLEEVESYITKNKHLPEIPSAASIDEKGSLSLGTLNLLLLKKIEELTLYTIQQQKELDQQKELIRELSK